MRAIRLFFLERSFCPIGFCARFGRVTVFAVAVLFAAVCLGKETPDGSGSDMLYARAASVRLAAAENSRRVAERISELEMRAEVLRAAADSAEKTASDLEKSNEERAKILSRLREKLSSDSAAENSAIKAADSAMAEMMSDSRVRAIAEKYFTGYEKLDVCGRLRAVVSALGAVRAADLRADSADGRVSAGLLVRANSQVKTESDGAVYLNVCRDDFERAAAYSKEKNSLTAVGSKGNSK